jgi:hypothetical protein
LIFRNERHCGMPCAPPALLRAYARNSQTHPFRACRHRRLFAGALRRAGPNCRFARILPKAKFAGCASFPLGGVPGCCAQPAKTVPAFYGFCSSARDGPAHLPSALSELGSTAEKGSFAMADWPSQGVAGAISPSAGRNAL